MAEFTQNYNLNKPSYDDIVDVQVLNANMDIIDEALENKAPLVDGKIPEEYLPEGSTSGLQLGETEDTAFRGDHGKAAYDHSLEIGNPHGTTAEDITYEDTTLKAIIEQIYEEASGAITDVDVLEDEVAAITSSLNQTFNNVVVTAGGADHPNQIGLTFYRTGETDPLTIYFSEGGASMIFVDNVASLTTLGTPPTGVSADLIVGQQAFVSDTQRVYFLTAVGDNAPTSYVWKLQASDAPTWQDTAKPVTFYSTTSDGYNSISQKDGNTLYFLTDEGKIYRGDVDVTSAVRIMDSFGDSSTAREGKLYIGPAPDGESAGYEVRVVANGAWQTIGPAYYTDGANWAATDSNKFATIGLIKKGIAEAIANIDFDQELLQKVDKVESAIENNVVLFGADGNIVDLGYSIGGTEMNVVPSDKILVTETMLFNALKWRQF